MNDFNGLTNSHYLSYELGKQMQAEILQRHQHVDRPDPTTQANDRLHFLVRYHFRSLMYRLVPRIAARMML